MSPREKGRQKELDNIRDFGAAEEVTHAEAVALSKKIGESTPDMRWVEERQKFRRKLRGLIGKPEVR